MKLVSNIVKKYLESAPRIVHFVSDVGFFKEIDEPCLSSDILCEFCNSSQHCAVYKDLIKNSKLVRICTNQNCITTTIKMF